MMITNRNLGLYIHIPFCERKCEYCGFLSFPMEEFQKEICLSYIKEEIRLRGKRESTENKEIDTIFIGGGTPSLLTAHQITELFNIIRESFNIKDDAEITIEANPNSLTEEKLQAYKKSNINRLSIGVQSFDNDILKILGRLHNAKEAEDIIKKAKEIGFKNLNIDLMFAVPGQSMETWKASLEKTISLEPAHISFYSLQIEEETAFYKAYKEESLEFISDEVMNRMYEVATKLLKTAGYEHYEISNAAKKGYHCRHNMKYWNMEDFVAVGPGACGYENNIRYENPHSIEKWMQSVDNATLSPKDNDEIESIEDSISIFCFTALRTKEGIDLKRFQNVFGKTIFEVFSGIKETLETYEKKGYLVIDDDKIALTEKGFIISNDIMCEFV